MSLTRGHYSVSDLLKIDAKRKSTVLPYICLAEAFNDDFIQSAKCELSLNTNRIVKLLDWVKENRKLVFTLNGIGLEHFRHITEDADSVTNTFDMIVFYYLVEVEKSFNCRVKLNLSDSVALEILLDKFGNSVPFIPKRLKSALLDSEFIDEIVEKVTSIYEYKEKVKSLTDVPDSFYEVEMLFHDYLVFTGAGLQIKVVTENNNKLKEKCQKYDATIHKLKNTIKSLEDRLKSCEEQNSSEKHIQQDLEEQIDSLQEDLLLMQNKITSLEYRNKILSLTVTKEDILINEQLIVEENELIDLSRYNIILCGNDRHLKKYNYRILDYYAGPQRITMLDKADVIAIITTDIEHAAYWAIKNYCKSHGLKFCNINGNTTRIVESSLKDYIRENLL